MRYINITKILYKLTKRVDYIGKEELYIIINNNKYNLTLINNNNDWVYEKDIFIPYDYNININISVYDKDIYKDDKIIDIDFKIGQEYNNSVLRLKYKIINISDYDKYLEDKNNSLKQINELIDLNENKSLVNDELINKIKTLRSDNAVYKIKITDLLKRNKYFFDKINKIKNIIT